MKKQFLILLLLCLFAGKKEYAQDVLVTKSEPAFFASRDVSASQLPVEFISSDGEINSARGDVYSRRQVLKKITGSSVSISATPITAITFLTSRSLPQLTHTTSSYLDFIFPFYCFW